MLQGLRVNLGLMGGVVLFALLTSLAPTAAMVLGVGAALVGAALRWPDDVPKWGLYAIVALVPLSVIGGRLPLPFFNSLPKVIFPVAFGALLAGSALSHRRFVFGWQGLFGVLFLGVILLSHLMNVETEGSYQGVIRPLNMVLLLLLALNVLKTGRDVAILLAIMVTASLLSALGGILMPIQWAAGYGPAGMERLSGWTYQNDAPTFGLYLVLSTLVCLYFLLTDRRLSWRIALLPVSVLLIDAIMKTWARGSIIVLAVTLLYLVFSVRKRISGTVLVLGLIFIALVVVPLIPDKVYERFSVSAMQAGNEGSIRWRLESARIGLELFERSPLIGRGPGNFPAEYMASEFRFNRLNRPGSVMGNTPLSILYQTGVIGLSIFLLLIAVTWRDLWLVKRSYAVVSASRPAGDDQEGDFPFQDKAAEILGILLVALLLFSLISTLENEKYLWIVLAAAGAMARIRRDKSRALALESD